MNEQHAVILLLLWSGLNYISGNWGQIGCLGLLENLTNLNNCHANINIEMRRK